MSWPPGQNGMRPSHRVSLPTLFACCCWTSQNPHPNTSRSASLSVGGWHQALAGGASDSPNTFTLGLNPYQEPPLPGREALRKILHTPLNSVFWYQCYISCSATIVSTIITPIFVIQIVLFHACLTNFYQFAVVLILVYWYNIYNIIIFLL